MSVYRSGPSKAWLKLKNPKAPAATARFGRHVLIATWSVACGFREPASYKRLRLSSRCDGGCGLPSISSRCDGGCGLPSISSRCDGGCGLPSTQPAQSVALRQAPAPFPSPCELPRPRIEPKHRRQCASNEALSRSVSATATWLLATIGKPNCSRFETRCSLCFSSPGRKRTGRDEERGPVFGTHGSKV